MYIQTFSIFVDALKAATRSASKGFGLTLQLLYLAVIFFSFETNAGGIKGRTLVPAAPTALTATGISSSQINLSWQDNSGNELGFIVQRANSSSGPWTQIGTTGVNVTTYANTGLSGTTT